MLGNSTFIGLKPEDLIPTLTLAADVATALKKDVLRCWEALKRARNDQEKTQIEEEHKSLIQMLYVRPETGLLAIILSTQKIFDGKETGPIMRSLQKNRVKLCEPLVRDWLNVQKSWEADVPTVRKNAGSLVANQDWLCRVCGQELSNIFFIAMISDNDKEIDPGNTKSFCFDHKPDRPQKLYRIAPVQELTNTINQIYSKIEEEN